MNGYLRQTLGLPPINGVQRGRQRVIFVPRGGHSPFGNEQSLRTALMDLSETYQREVNLDIVVEGSRGKHYVIRIGEADDVGCLTDRDTLRQFGGNARLVRTIHTQPGRVVSPSNADLWIGAENTADTEILSRGSGMIFHYQIAQRDCANMLLNRVRRGALGLEQWNGILPEDVEPSQRQLLEGIFSTPSSPQPFSRLIRQYRGAP
jgi:hypothetical protein